MMLASCMMQLIAVHMVKPQQDCCTSLAICEISETEEKFNTVLPAGGWIRTSCRINQNFLHVFPGHVDISWKFHLNPSITTSVILSTERQRWAQKQSIPPGGGQLCFICLLWPCGIFRHMQQQTRSTVYPQVDNLLVDRIKTY